MGSVGSPLTSRTPFEAYKECAQGLCNKYCSQWCNYPPPLGDSGDDPGTSFSPLIIAVIGILASAFLLVCYYAIITKYCRGRRWRWRNHNQDQSFDEGGLIQLNQDQFRANSNGGLDEGLIKSITVFRYKKGVGLVEGTECSVCLNEFQENENLRLLPKCCHAFHPSCIDIWLKSHSNCPLCRANAAPISTTPSDTNTTAQSSSVHVSAMESHRPSDLVLFVNDHQEFVENQEVCDDGVSRGGLRISDVLEMNEDDDEEIKVEIQRQLEIKIIGSSKRG